MQHAAQLSRSVLLSFSSSSSRPCLLFTRQFFTPFRRQDYYPSSHWRDDFSPFTPFSNEWNRLLDEFDDPFRVNRSSRRAKQQQQQQQQQSRDSSQQSKQSEDTSLSPYNSSPFSRFFPPQFSSFFDSESLLPSFSSLQSQLKLNILKEKDKYTVQVDLPGVEKKDIKLNVEDGYLTVAAERRHELEEKDESTDASQVKAESTNNQQTPATDKSSAVTHTNDSTNKPISSESSQQQLSSPRWLRREVSYGSVERSIRLTKDVDVSRITAKHESGVLKITLPRVEKQQQDEINIE